MDERGLGNSNFRPYQKIETINRLSRSMETLLQGANITTSTGGSNNDGDSGINETHDYHNEGEGVDLLMRIQLSKLYQ